MAELADSLNLSTRSVQNWIYKGIIPKGENRREVCEILNASENILFGPAVFGRTIINKKEVKT